jgi:hypothetical protein
LLEARKNELVGCRGHRAVASKHRKRLGRISS